MYAIQQINAFLEDAGTLHISSWGHKYYMARPSFLRSFEAFKKELADDTPAGQACSHMIQVLEHQELDQNALALALSQLSSILESSDSPSHTISRFKELTERFAKHIQKQSNHARNTQKNLSDEEKDTQDTKLFEGPGMMFVLEYYLSLYKELCEKQTIAEKTNYINAEQVNFGFGTLPGIKEDLCNDESYEKFIVQILNKEVREELEEAYFELKDSVLHCNDTLLLQQRIKEFLVILLKTFEKKQIEKLGSTFLKPYGEKPRIQEVIDQL